MDRVEWETLFMSMAFLVSQRSPDSETKIGCILVDESNRILSLGFNGFPRGCKDDKLPCTRPDKYPYMVHAEANCLLNAKSVLNPNLCTMYITAMPCAECLKLIIQAGIGTVVYGTIGTKIGDHHPDDFYQRILENVPLKLYGFNQIRKDKVKEDIKNLLFKTIDYIEERF